MKRIGTFAALVSTVLLVSTGCGVVANPTPSATSPAGSVPAGQSSGGSPGPAATTGPTTTPTAASMADVDVADITSMDASSVTWTDAKRVPAADNNVKVEPLTGPEHVHTAAIASNATFFLPFDQYGGVSIGSDGLGDQPCTRAQFVAAVNNGVFAPKIFFNGQSQVIKIAARYHP